MRLAMGILQSRDVRDEPPTAGDGLLDCAHGLVSAGDSLAAYVVESARLGVTTVGRLRGAEGVYAEWHCGRPSILRLETVA